ncbi:MAG: replicative DNA helicase [Sphingobacteriaceae bacterium]|nr:replicative DNA helicase [Sphingobacteriaceae bacterium]
MEERNMPMAVTSSVGNRKTRIPDSHSVSAGKLPPQAIDLEEAVLGALMLEKEALSQVIDILQPAVFYVEKNQHVFRAIQKLFEQSKPVDLLTVTQELRQLGLLDKVGGAFYIAELTNRVASAANIEFHARILLEKYILRELVRISSDITKQAFEETTDVFELLDKAETDLFAVAEQNIRRNSEGMSTLVAKAIKQIEAIGQQEEGLSGVPSGFTDMDRMTNGWQRGTLNIIAARPAMGKTAFVLSLARNAAVDFKKGVAFFSLEMGAIELVNRLISGEAEIEAEKIKKGKLEGHEWTQLNTKVAKLSEAPFFIDDTPQLTLFELRAKCRRLKAQHDIQLIIIDYLQLMSGGPENAGGNREQVIASISRGLKALSKELSVPVIALSQLSRAVETRGGDKKPQLSDLRESGSIEQDADMVMFIYRGDYYGLEPEIPGSSQIIIAKHRNGQTGEVNLKFIDKYAKFVNLETDFSAFGAPSAIPYGGYGGGSGSDQQANVRVMPSKMNNFGNEEAPF